MRQIHPTRFHEKFVASGVYVHYEDEQPTGALEYWSIHELPDGARLIRVDEQGRERADYTLLEVWRSAAGAVERYDVHSYRSADTYKHLRAEYLFYPDYVSLTCEIDGIHRHADAPLPPGYAALPPLTLFCGFWALESAARGGRLIAVSHLPTAEGLPALVEVEVGALSTRFHLALDEYHIPLRITFIDRPESILLTQYARRPELNQP